MIVIGLCATLLYVGNHNLGTITELADHLDAFVLGDALKLMLIMGVIFAFVGRVYSAVLVHRKTR